MTGYITLYSGEKYRLPDFTYWSFNHTIGDGADAFEVRWPIESDMTELLQKAVRFTAVENGETVFYGVVDEYEAEVTEKGAAVFLTGRGLAAVLMDNESDAVEYSVCTLSDILRDHIRPYGIVDIEADGLGSLSDFSIASGSSEWKALCEFARWAGRVTPYFSRDGRLIISKNSIGNRLKIEEKSGLISYGTADSRYGIVSEVTVKGNTNGAQSTIYNGEFIARGGMCRRVIYVPNFTGYDAMRYTGEYQIEKSEEGKRKVTAVFSVPFYAFAGDTVELNLPKIGAAGEFRVSESCSWADKSGAGTELVLIPR